MRKRLLIVVAAIVLSCVIGFLSWHLYKYFNPERDIAFAHNEEYTIFLPHISIGGGSFIAFYNY